MNGNTKPPSTAKNLEMEVIDPVKKVNQTLRILMDHNGCLYINPDIQHHGVFRRTPDLLSIYSTEIKALRKLVSLLMSITTRQRQIIAGRTVKAVGLKYYKDVEKYLAKASWQLSLITDPEF